MSSLYTCKGSIESLSPKTSFESLAGAVSKAQVKSKREYAQDFEDSYFQFAKKFNQYKEDTSPPPPQHAVNNRYTPNGPGKIFPEEEDVIILDKPHGGLYSAPPDENSPVLRRRNDYGGGKGKEKYVDDDAMSRESEEAERLKAELDQSKNQLDNLLVFSISTICNHARKLNVFPTFAFHWHLLLAMSTQIELKSWKV